MKRDTSFLQNTKSHSPISRISKYSKLTAAQNKFDAIDFEQYIDKINSTRYEQGTFANFADKSFHKEIKIDSIIDSEI